MDRMGLQPAPNPMELLSQLHQVNVCGPQNGVTFKQLNNYKVLVELGRGIMAIAGLHFSASAAPNDVEKEVREATAMYKDFLQRSGNLENIFNKESPLKPTAITLLPNKTAAYNSDDVLDSTRDRQQAEMGHYKRTMQIEWARVAYRAKLDLKPSTSNLTRCQQDSASSANIVVAYRPLFPDAGSLLTR